MSISIQNKINLNVLANNRINKKNNNGSEYYKKNEKDESSQENASDETSENDNFSTGMQLFMQVPLTTKDGALDLPGIAEMDAPGLQLFLAIQRYLVGLRLNNADSFKKDYKKTESEFRPN